MAKRFFHACGGLFLLALSYHLGASNAHGNAASIEAATSTSGVVGRAFYAWILDINGQGHSTLLDSVPGTESVIATSYEQGISGANGASAMLANGDIYVWRTDMSGSGTWMLAGNLLGGATPTARSTWGALKARYR